MGLDERSGWVVRSDLEGVMHLPALQIEDACPPGTPPEEVYYRKPGGRGLYAATEIYATELDALEALGRLLRQQLGMLEMMVADLEQQAAGKRAKLRAVQRSLGRIKPARGA